MADPLVQTKTTNKVLVAEKHAEIVSKATELFLEKGFHATSIRDIANAVGWNMGTLYLYISRKEDVLYLIADAILQQLRNASLEAEKDAPKDITGLLRAKIEKLFDVNSRMTREVRLIYRESASMLPEHLEALKDNEANQRGEFSDLIAKGVEEGLFDSAIRPELVASTILLLANMWPLKSWLLKRTMSFEEYKADQIRAIMRSLGVDPG